ncbi:DUF58 domain-containing protein [Haloarcula amylovorans]|uniref:DUF58 domain-containing protein n=1 Tax=Haloarcula amylovorans TaxID=2562280 RepID=UPI0010763410|nr:DUF58 domain-containing protein [Halomicroarcula amylolytica]
MNYRRRAALVVGVLVVVAGLWGALTGAFSLSLRPGTVVFVGVFAVGLGLYGAYRRYRTEPRSPVLRDPATRDVSPPEPATDGFGSGSTRRIEQHRLTEDVRSLLRRALTRGEGDTDAADAALASGEWTDDPSASAAFERDVGRRRQYRDRLAARLGETTRLAYRLERAATGLRSVLGLTADDDALPEPRRTSGLGTVQTGRWAGFRVVPFVFVGVGLVARRPGLVLAGAVAVVALAVSAASRAPDPDLIVNRAVDAADPTHGEEVTVTMQVRNDGDRTLFDCRLADGVPDTLAVTEGSAQLATALRPDATATVEYTVRATRGDHAFGPPRAVVGDAAGTAATVTEPTVTGDDSLSVSLPPEDLSVPVRSRTTQHRGRIKADSGGDGIAFYATREYRPGDPLSRIDWNRYASTRDLSTLQFREEQAATVVVLVDARPAAYHAPTDPSLDTTVDRAVVAARGVVGARIDAEDQVGLAALSTERLFVPPGGGHAHRSRLETVLSSADAFGPTPADGEFYVGPTFRWLQRELPNAAQVVCCSPLTDDTVVRTLRYLAAYGHPVTVLSPDPGTRPTAAGTVAAAKRLFRLSDLRRQGIPVIDWRHGESLAAAIERQGREWSA